MHTTAGSLVGVRDACVAVVLEDAALYLVTYGWCQDNYFEEVSGTLPRACAAGAIYAVTDPHSKHHARRGTNSVSASQAISYLADFLDDGIWRGDASAEAVVWTFNDHADTTKELVIHALRTAAKRARVELSDGQVCS